MRNRELREWLGLTPADGLVWCSAAAIVAMYHVRSAWIDASLGVVALSLVIQACRIGMVPDMNLSTTTNHAKRISYPVALAMVVLGIGLNFAFWNAE